MCSPKLLPAFFLVLGLGTVAHAEKKVDWSEYLEPPGSPGPALKHTSMPAPAAKPAAVAAPAEPKPARKVAKRPAAAKRPAPKKAHR